MDGARTRGQRPAVEAIATMVRAGAPQSILVVGPAGVGKTTLALDLAAGLLCIDPDPERRPCRACRGCRLVDSGNHPDLHRLAPSGAGGQIRIGDRTNPEPGTIRHLLSELALHPVEGGPRVAIVEAAERLNEDAQSALLKTLEESSAGTVIVLCTEDDERLLPTVRSRCARVRLGPVPVRDVEAIVVERGIADAPTAARLARLTGGRPGIALLYAAEPETLVLRSEIARTLLDLLAAASARRLAIARDLLGRADELARRLASASSAGPGSATASPPVRGRGKTTARTAPSAAAAPTGSDADAPSTAEATAAADDGAAAPAGQRASAAERRRAAMLLVEIWRDVVRDVILHGMGEMRGLRDADLLEDPAAPGGRLDGATATAFLARLVRAGELLEANVSPELVIDGLLVAWRARPAA